MTVQFRLCIVMISQKSPFIESDVNEKTSIIFIYYIIYIIYEEKLLYMAFKTVTMKKT